VREVAVAQVVLDLEAEPSGDQLARGLRERADDADAGDRRRGERQPGTVAEVDLVDGVPEQQGHRDDADDRPEGDQDREGELTPVGAQKSEQVPQRRLM
jgi:hypothetical protein